MTAPTTHSKALFLAAVLIAAFVGPFALDAAAQDCHSETATQPVEAPVTPESSDSCCCDAPMPAHATASCACDLGQAPAAPTNTPAAHQVPSLLRILAPMPVTLPMGNFIHENLTALAPENISLAMPHGYVANCALLR